MKKRIVSLVLAVVSILCFASCKGTEAKSPAVADVVKAIRESTSFSELVALNDDNIATRYYGIDLEAIEEYEVLVCGTGAAADEIAVFKMKSQDDVEDMRDVVLERKEELYDRFVDYVPDEAPKIQNAVVSSKGKYVYFIVSEDHKAAKEAAGSCF